MNEVSELRIALQELSELRRRVYSTTQLSTVSRACNTLVEFCTQKADPFLDGFGEVNPWKRSAHKSEPEASKRSRDIDQVLVPSNKIQIVCLAAPESGFDEILRKIHLSHMFSTAESDEYKRHLKQNLITVLRHVAKQASSSLSEYNQKLYKRLLRDEHGTNFDGIMTPNVADSLRSLWRDPAVQHVYHSISSTPLVTGLIGNLTIEGIIKYVDHLQDPAFAPTVLDAAYFFDHATGIREAQLQNEDSDTPIQLLDFTNLPVVGEGEFCNHSWVSQFQNCTFIFCYVPLHTYDEKIDQESEQTDLTNQTKNTNHINSNAQPPITVTPPPIDPTKTPTNNLIKSTSMGTSLPSSKSNIPTSRARSNSTNAKYTSSSKPGTLRPLPPTPQNNTTEKDSNNKSSKINNNSSNIPPRESALPPQIIGFDVASHDHLNPKRKSVYRNSMLSRPNAAHNFVRRTVQERKPKSIHVAASHRLSSPSTTPVASPSSSPSLNQTSSPPTPSPPSPPPPPPSSTPSQQSSQPLSIPPSSRGGSFLEPPQSKSNRKPNGSFLVITSSPPSPTPSSPPKASHSSSFLAPLKVGQRKSWENLLSPFSHPHGSSHTLIPSPSTSASRLSSSFRKSTHERNSVSYGSLAPLSLVALPNTPTLADIFKLPCYLKRFSALVNDESLLQVPVLVTFVVTPTFSEKIKEVDLDVCFPEYEGDHTEQSALEFIKKIFIEQNANPTRKIFTRVLHTSSPDPTNEVKSLLNNAISSQLYQ